MATAAEVAAVRQWAGDLSGQGSNIMTDQRVDDIIETFRPNYAAGGRLIKVAAIELCQQLAVWHRDQHPDEATAYQDRAGYLRALPSFALAQPPPAMPPTRYFLFVPDGGATPTEAQLQAAGSDPNISGQAGAGVLWIWSSSRLTSVVLETSFGQDNILDLFARREFSVAGQDGFLYSTALLANAVNGRWSIE